MNFSEQLSVYKEEIGFTMSDLAEKSGLSASVISRYFSGKRKPQAESGQLISLCHGIFLLAEEKGKGLSESEIMASFHEIQNPMIKAYLSERLDILIHTLNVNVSQLALALNFDTSYISKIRNGNRIPANVDEFIMDLCRFVVKNFHAPEHLKSAALMLSCSVNDLKDSQNYQAKLLQWFSLDKPSGDESLSRFLTSVDQFDLNAYIKRIHFDELKVPTMPFSFHIKKDYYGLEEMRQGELDFLKASVLAPAKEPIYMYSDMPMEDLAEGEDFMKKYMFGLALALKKGHHIYIIHNLDRPYKELMMGLEGWIPLYMTGQIHPFYLPGKPSAVFKHLINFSGTAALIGESIGGHHENGHYYFTQNKKELQYYKEFSRNLFQEAKSLMDIYTLERKTEFYHFLDKSANDSGTRRDVLSVPPLYTISGPLLEKILSHNSLSESEKENIRQICRRLQHQTEMILKDNEILLELPSLTEEEFQNNPLSLPISELFLDKDISYAYDEYLEHVALTKQFAHDCPKLKVSFTENFMFQNIQIHILEDKWVCISKNKAPSIQFVIHQPMLRKAIEKL